MPQRRRRGASSPLWVQIAAYAALAVALVATWLHFSDPTPSRGGPGRAHALSLRCPFADVVPGEETIRRVRVATLCLINAERTGRGLRTLHAAPLLDRVADGFAEQMAVQRFFDHISPGGSTLLSRVTASGYLRRGGAWSLGENLAFATGAASTPRATVRAWMRSPPHRANLLDSEFTEVGIGSAAGGAPAEINPDGLGDTYVTDFGRRISHRRATVARGHRPER